jgi:hypothetical protein
MIAIWFSKSTEVQHIKEEAAKDNQLLKGEATRQVVQSHEEHLRLLAKPFVWAIRAEMIQGNFKQIRLYMNEMVENPNFQHIAVVDNKGTIILSTNKKEEGKHFSTIGRSTYLFRTETSLENVGNKKLIMSSPILGSRSRLGTLIIQYGVQPVTFN